MSRQLEVVIVAMLLAGVPVLALGQELEATPEAEGGTVEGVISTDADAKIDAVVAVPAKANAVVVEPVEPVFTNPDKQIETDLRRISGEPGKVALLPSMQVYWAVRNQINASGGVFRKHQDIKEIAAPFDRQLMDRVAVVLQDDLSARFQAAGWQAVTRAELGADVPQLKTIRTDSKQGIPMYEVGGNGVEMEFAAVALPGAEPVDPKGISNGMAMGRFLKGKSGVNVNVTYSFAPGTASDANTKQLATEVGSGLWFSARADLHSASGGWGSIKTRDEGLVVAEDIGTLAEVEGSGVGTAVNVLRYMSGAGSIAKKGYTMAPDWSKAEVEMLRAGRAFNAELVRLLAM